MASTPAANLPCSPSAAIPRKPPLIPAPRTSPPVRPTLTPPEPPGSGAAPRAGGPRRAAAHAHSRGRLPAAACFLTPRYFLTARATGAPFPLRPVPDAGPGLQPPGGRALCLPRGPPTPAPEGGSPGASPAQEEPQLFVPRAGQAPGLPAPPGAEGSAPEDVEETDGD